MHYTYSHKLPDLALPVGPNSAETVRLGGPVVVDVSFIYEAARPALPTLPNGDPGEEGAPEYFDFKDVTIPSSLVLPNDNGDMRTVMSSGKSIIEHLTNAELDAIEAAMVAKVHDNTRLELADLVMPTFTRLLAEDRL